MKLKVLFTIITLFIYFGAVAQTESNYTIKQFEAALKQYSKLVKEDKILESEKFILAENEKYPMWKLNEIALDKIKSGDVKGANKFWDSLIFRIKRIPEGTKAIKGTSFKESAERYYYNQQSSNLSIGSITKGINVTKDYVQYINGQPYEKSYLNAMLNSGLENAYYLDDIESVKYLADASMKMKNERGIFASKAYMLLLEDKNDEAIKYLEDVAEKGIGFMGSKTYANYILIEAYSKKGDYQKLSAALNKLSKNIFVSDRMLGGFLGQRALHQKDYAKAIDFFTDALKPIRFLNLSTESPLKYRNYTNRAVTYFALGDYVRARKDFETALFYNENYQPALDGLAKLEGNQVTVRKADKTGPNIKILEPTNMRGLIVVTSGNDVMIKGLASDPSGTKSVTINGLSVYTKEEGDFWGSIALTEGINKIEIIASDMAGNSTKQNFEIEKQASAVAPIAVTAKQGENYAMFIASQNYDDETIPSLENPIPDAIKLKLILKNSYNFADENIFTLFNPQRNDFKKKFLELREEIQPEDNLIIFYAGHGIWVEKEKKGYWLLTDAVRNDVNTWIPNKQVLEMIAELPSRNTLLITDACFSGSVFKTRSIGEDAPTAIKEMNNKISRVAITSGNDTEVPDVSVFMKHLIKALTQNKEKYLSAQKMFITQIIEAVMTESNTEPRYGTLELAGHVGGDYVFMKK